MLVDGDAAQARPLRIPSLHSVHIHHAGMRPLPFILRGVDGDIDVSTDIDESSLGEGNVGEDDLAVHHCRPARLFPLRHPV